MEEFLKIISVYFVAVFKFWFAFPAAKLAGFNFSLTFAISALGGISGFFLFYFFSTYVFKIFSLITFKVKKFLGINIQPILQPKKRIFNTRSRWFAKIMQRFGIWGLAFISPSLISIPVGSTIAANLSGRVAKKKLKVIMIFCMSICLWSLIFSSIVFLFD